MRRRTVASAAIAVLILVAGFAFLIKARGFRASSTPGAFETSAARVVRDFAIPRAAKGQKNPFLDDADHWSFLKIRHLRNRSSHIEAGLSLDMP